MSFLVSHEFNQVRYDIQPTIIYIGYAPTGALPANKVWSIKKIILDISGNPVMTTWSNSTSCWDERASLYYS